MTDQVYLIFWNVLLFPKVAQSWSLTRIIQRTVTVDRLQHTLEQARIPAQQCLKPYDDPETLRPPRGLVSISCLRYDTQPTARAVGLTVIS